MRTVGTKHEHVYQKGILGPFTCLVGTKHEHDISQIGVTSPTQSLPVTQDINAPILVPRRQIPLLGDG
jgi:hypothetical protein